MNVDEAIAYASKDKCFWIGEVHTALEMLASEVERLRAEVQMCNSFHRVAVKERDFERLLVEALKEELAAAKDQFVNDCIKHINRVGLLNDCEFESGMIADSVQEYFGDKQCL